MPQDCAAEANVIAGVLRGGQDAYLDICDIVTPNTFTDPLHEATWMCLSHLYSREEVASIDYPTLMSVASSLGVQKELERNGAKTRLREIYKTPIKASNTRRFAGKIRKLEVGRLILEQFESARKKIDGLTGDEKFSDIILMAEEPIFDFTSLLTDEGMQDTVKMGDGALEYVNFLMENPRDQVGIATGISSYDHAIGGGIRSNSLDIIAARPKTGKTWLVDSVGVHVADVEKIPSYNIDTEMTQEEHLNRVLAMLSGVPVKMIETGKFSLDPIMKKKVLDAVQRLESMPYYYRSIIGLSFEDMVAGMRRWVTRTVGLNANGKANPCVIIYDYLKMLSQDFTGAGLQEYQALGYITTALKNFMGRYGVGCLCFAQLNREGIEKEDTDALAGSDRIVHYCTSLTFYKKKTEEEKAEQVGEHQKWTHKLIPIIGRHGEGLEGGDYINILADYKHGRVIEGPTRFSAGKATPKLTGKAVEVGTPDDDEFPPF